MEDSDVYIVEAITGHAKYEELVEQYRTCTDVYDFQPNCRNERTHSVVCYLVKWKEFDVSESTWEPESNLLDNTVLEQYKKLNGHPKHHKVFDKMFDFDQIGKERTRCMQKKAVGIGTHAKRMAGGRDKRLGEGSVDVVLPGDTQKRPEGSVSSGTSNTSKSSTPKAKTSTLRNPFTEKLEDFVIEKKSRWADGCSDLGAENGRAPSEQRSNFRVLLKSNYAKVASIFAAPFTRKKFVKVDVRNIVEHYTFGRIDELRHALKNVPEDVLVPLVKALIEKSRFLRSPQPTSAFSSDREKRQDLIYELLAMENFGQESDQRQVCSTEHWKCRMLAVLLEVLPKEERFSKESSPFVDDVFIQCLRFGAPCQQTKFIDNDVPLVHRGFDDQSPADDRKRVGSVHFAVLSCDSLDRLFALLVFGFDPSAFFQWTDTKKFEILVHFVDQHMEELKICAPDERKLKYFGVVRNTLRRFQALLQAKVTMNLLKQFCLPHEMCYQIGIYVTPPHIVRVSGSNGSKGGFYTCLFWPIGADGLKKMHVLSMIEKVKRDIISEKSALVACVCPVVIDPPIDVNNEKRLPKVKRVQCENAMSVTLTICDGENQTKGSRIESVEYRMRDKKFRLFFLGSCPSEIESLQEGLAYVEIEADLEEPQLFIVQLGVLTIDRLEVEE